MALEDITTMLEFILWLSWNMLSLASSSVKNPIFSRIFPTEAAMEAILLASGFVLPNGLLDVVQCKSPPPLSFFKTLPTEFGQRWGIYVIVLEKQTCRPRIYIGSGTEKRSGVSMRIGQYRRRENLAKSVRDALNQGFNISHIGLLCWTPLPPASRRRTLRALYLIIEAAFTLWFWAMVSRTRDYGMPVTLCPWPLDTMDYDGCCNHFSLVEGGNDILDVLSPEELDDVERETKIRNSRRDNAKRGATIKRLDQKKKRQKALANKKWFCSVCNVNFGARNQLSNHETTRKHLDKVAGITRPVKTPLVAVRHAENIAAKRFRCNPCDYNASTQTRLNTHLASKKHLKKVTESGS